MISMIAAVADNGVIGHHGGIPWHMPADLRYFKTTTMNNTVVMGRKTLQNILDILGTPLPGRTNVVLSHDSSFHVDDVATVGTVGQVLDQYPDAMIIGGETLYEQFMPYAGRLYITKVHTTLEGDTYFPPIDRDAWTEVWREDHTADEKNQYDYSLVTYERRT